MEIKNQTANAYKSIRKNAYMLIALSDILTKKDYISILQYMESELKKLVYDCDEAMKGYEWDKEIDNEIK